MITDKVKWKVFYRDKGKCILCYNREMLERIPHHVFFRSEYFKEDKDKDWNLVLICMNCHYKIHHGIGGKELAKKCKEIAFARYNGQYRDELVSIMRVKYKKDWLGCV